MAAMTRHKSFSVLVAGGGVAALETALELRELGEGAIRVELLAPEPSFWYRPVAVAEPFGLGEVRHFDLGSLAEAAGAGLTIGALTAVDSDRREARTTAGATLAYDALLIACGALPRTAVPGALTFRGPADADRMRELLDELEGGGVGRVAFAVPWGAVWALPAYELALMTAARLSARDVRGVEVTLVTPEDEPLQLFGHTASETVRQLLDETGVGFVGGVSPAEHQDGQLLLLPEGAVVADRVVALPRLQGQRIDGIPQTVEGFVMVDDHCCVLGTDVVFAAGDITSFPVKQGGIAAQQAVVAAEAIAVHAGISLMPRPFQPVLRGMLLTGSGPRYLRRDLAKAGERDWVSEAPLWWPPTKIVGRRLAPFLASFAGEEEAPDTSPPAGGVAVEVALERHAVDRLATPRLATESQEATPSGETTVSRVMARDPLQVSQQTTLHVLARKMRERDVGAALVVEDDRLVGILTARDVLRALAGTVRASETSVREWMTADPISVGPAATLGDAEALMTEYGVHHLPVVDNGRPAGMLELGDVTRARRLRTQLAIGLGF
jgi:sulfide:quinone oxidoreductase